MCIKDGVLRFPLDRSLRTLVFVCAAALTFCYYNWLARATGNTYYWKHDLNGYYNHLARAFTQGRLDLPLDPSKELLALKDPWDPSLNQGLRLQDAVLYKGRFYLYHGAGPAVVLFAPWRLITGYDLPENFGLVLLCFIAWLFLAGCLWSAMQRFHVSPGPVAFGGLLLVLTCGAGLPYLLIRTAVYELAIATALVGASGGWFFYSRSVVSRRPYPWLVASGTMFALALASRPHVGVVAGVVALGLLALGREWKRAAVLAIPFVSGGSAVLGYTMPALRILSSLELTISSPMHATSSA